ncbi:Disintegrin-domain-containing protein [Atractiella rhizophila]|nr:Disintegrin-domain-containing protein [Atractiella rhizophila]
MSPVSTQNVTSFSQCSIGNVCSTISNSLNTTCLSPPGSRTTLSLQQCGNGIVEPGEDCDTGGVDSPCCNSSTCRFTSSSVCDPLNSACCTDSCAFASNGTVCRPSIDSRCDIAETCTGFNATCPEDTFVKDKTSCGSGLQCASGLCTSRDQQCAAQGGSLGITKSCSGRTSSSCQVTCADPDTNSDCVLLESNFRDGTECGYAGTCQSGKCKEGNWLDVAKGWYTQNLQIAIPVTVVAGIIVLLTIFSCLRCIFFGRRRSPYQTQQRQPPMAAAGNFGRGRSILNRARGLNRHGLPLREGTSPSPLHPVPRLQRL